MALYSAAFILLLLANAFPFLTLEIQGRSEVTNIFGASRALYNAGMGELAVVVFLTSMLAPALLITSRLSPLPRHSDRGHCFAYSPNPISLPRMGGRVCLCNVLFEDCSAFTRYGLHTRQVT
ncbi:MAG: paraquat-inducible protein A [Pseudomonadota bacterium]